MANLTLPILLAVIGLVIGVISYRTIQRGNARFYALEREKLLRQAGYTLLGALALFIGSVALLVNSERVQQAEIADAEATAEAAPVQQVIVREPIQNDTQTIVEVVPEDDFVSNAPPTIVPTPTIDPNIPTATPKPIPKYASIVNTGESGVYIRKAPGTGADTLARLYDTNVVTMEEDEGSVEADGYRWVKVRTVTGDIGWIADPFIELNN